MSKQGGVRKVIQAENIEGHVGKMSIEEALEFVEGKKTGMGGSEAARKKTPKKVGNGSNPGMKKENSLTPPERKSSTEEELGREKLMTDTDGTSEGTENKEKKVSVF